MDRDFLIQLTCGLYRITLLFPKKDPLRLKMRDVGIDILAQMILTSPFQTEPRDNPEVLGDSKKWLFLKLENNLAVLDSYFEVALAQNWVSPKALLEIQNQYCKIRNGLKAPVTSRKAPGVEPREMVPKTALKKRQAKILEILKEKGRAQVQDFKKDFPNISKRTLRRDLRDLLEQGLIERIGERSETFYEIVFKPRA